MADMFSKEKPEIPRKKEGPKIKNMQTQFRYIVDLAKYQQDYSASLVNLFSAINSVPKIVMEKI
jgi:hypothetical protein